MIQDLYPKQVVDFVEAIKAGDAFKAYIPFANDPIKIHILYVLPSVYSDKKLFVYKVYGKHKRWWHEFMCSNWDMLHYYNTALNWNYKNKGKV